MQKKRQNRQTQAAEGNDIGNGNKSGDASELLNRQYSLQKMLLAVSSITLSENSKKVKEQGTIIPLTEATDSVSIPVNDNIETASLVSLLSTKLQLLLNIRSAICSTRTILHAPINELISLHRTTSITLANDNRSWIVLVIAVKDLATPSIRRISF